MLFYVIFQQNVISRLIYIQVQQMVSASIYICTPLAIECGVLKTFIKILAQQILHYDFFWQIKKKKIISIFIDEQNLHQMIEWMLLLSKYNKSRWWKNLMLVFLRKNKTESNHHSRHNPRISENLPINNETSQVSRQKLNVCHISQKKFIILDETPGNVHHYFRCGLTSQHSENKSKLFKRQT